MKVLTLDGESRIPRLCRSLARVVVFAFALVLVAGPARLHATTAVAKTFYYTTFGASNEAGSGSFSWDGTTLSVSTRKIVALPGFAIDGSLVVASDGNIYSGRAGSVYQIDPLTGEFQGIRSGVNNNVTSIEPTLTTLYVGWKDTPLATVGTGANFGEGTPHPISGDDTVATGLAFLPDGSVWYTTGGEDRLGNVGTINLTTYTTTRKLADVSATEIIYDPFTGDIFTAGIDGIAQINPASGTVVSTWANPQGQGNFIQNLAATGTGQLVAFDSSNLLRLWDFSSGSKLIGGAGTVIASAPTTVASGGLYLANVPPPSNLLNISTRLDVQTGDNVLIGGFIITGTDPKKVILRGIGPSLSPGVTGVLADPVLELHKFDGTVVTNDNWKDTQQMEIEDTGLAPKNDLESAIVATLEPGNYTAILSGKSGGTGIGLVEAYDLDQTVDSTLANISTRGFVETGDNVMIGGFIIGGGGESDVVVRAIGPSLSDAGVMNPLQDPNLELHDADGVVIATNDDWMDGPDQQTISDDGLAPTEDAESALLATLFPGAYTAIVRGAGVETGVGLVEVYNLH